MSFEDHDDERTITVRWTWGAVYALEVPDYVSTSEARDQIRDGDLPEWAAMQLDAAGADLTGWELA